MNKKLLIAILISLGFTLSGCYATAVEEAGIEVAS